MTPGGVCYRKGYERGLWFEIKSLEECIKLKELAGKDATFEKKLVRSYKKFSEKDYANREKP